MQTYTVIGVYEGNDLQTFAELVEAENTAQAAVIACRRWDSVSIVAIIRGIHYADMVLPEYAGQFTSFNGMDGADELTDEERGNLE